MENAQWTEAGVGSGGAGGDGTSLSVHPGVRSDPRLFTDDVDIRFSRALNSCKVPQIRYATPSRLLERLTGILIKLLINQYLKYINNTCY